MKSALIEQEMVDQTALLAINNLLMSDANRLRHSHPHMNTGVFFFREIENKILPPHLFCIHGAEQECHGVSLKQTYLHSMEWNGGFVSLKKIFTITKVPIDMGTLAVMSTEAVEEPHFIKIFLARNLLKNFSLRVFFSSVSANLK